MRIIVAHKLFCVLKKTDEHDDAGAHETDKKEHFQESHSVNREGHASIVA